MTYENKTLRGLDGKYYTLGSLLGQGGEGDVYEVVGDQRSVIKIYNDKKMMPSPFVQDMRSHMENKIKVMVRNPVEQNNKLGFLCISWPKDALYDGGKFVGYVMPRVKTQKKIYDVCRERSRERMFPNYTWQYSVVIALNLAWTVNSVHEKGYCIGDFNPNNILVNDRGNITLIDTDSFEITDVYKCMVGVPEMLAPELQGRGDLRDPRVKFTKESDRFSLAIHIFNLLMNNCHPFNCTNIASSRSSTSNEPIETGIAEGHFCYGRPLPAGIRLPVTAPSYDILPKYIRDLFDRAFTYTARTAYASAQKRPTADEWHRALLRMYKEPYVKCSQNSHHVYLSSCCSACPWCAIINITPPHPVKKKASQGNSQIPAAATINSYGHNSQPFVPNNYVPPTDPPQKQISWTGIIITVIVIMIGLTLIGRNSGSRNSQPSDPINNYIEIHGESINAIGRTYQSSFSQGAPNGIQLSYSTLLKDAYVSSDTAGIDMSGIDALVFDISGSVEGSLYIDGAYFERVGIWNTYGVHCDFLNMTGSRNQIEGIAKICALISNRFYNVRNEKAEYEIRNEIDSWGLGSGGWTSFFYENGFYKDISLGMTQIKASLYAHKERDNYITFRIYRETQDETSSVDLVAGSEYVPGKASGHSQLDEADMLDIVRHVFSQDDTDQVYCADFDGDGWMEAFVEEKIDAEDEYKRIWFMNHNEETSLVSEGGYLYLADTISLPNAVLMVVNTRHGLDTVYYVENGSVGVVDMPDDEWWYSIYKENETLWGTRVEYSDGKNYVDYPLEYDASLHRLYIFEGC